MKTIGFVLVMVGAAWSAAAAGAGQSVAAFQQAASRSAAHAVDNHSHDADHAAPTSRGAHVGNPSDGQQGHRKVSGNKLPTSKPSVSKSNRPSEPSNRRQRSASKGSMNSDLPGSDNTAGAAKDGGSRNETAYNATTVRPPGAVRPSAPSLSNVRHRGANPAIVGGPGNSNTRNTASLDGTHMNRKRAGS